jgi:hypothetical protein
VGELEVPLAGLRRFVAEADGSCAMRLPASRSWKRKSAGASYTGLVPRQTSTCTWPASIAVFSSVMLATALRGSDTGVAVCVTVLPTLSSARLIAWATACATAGRRGPTTTALRPRAACRSLAIVAAQLAVLRCVLTADARSLPHAQPGRQREQRRYDLPGTHAERWFATVPVVE